MVCNNPNLKCSHSVKFSYIWDNRFASNQCVMESKILTLHLMHLGSSYYALKHVYKEYTSRSSRVCSLENFLLLYLAYFPTSPVFLVIFDNHSGTVMFDCISRSSRYQLFWQVLICFKIILYLVTTVWWNLRQRKTSCDFILQGSSNGALTSRINRKSYESSVPNIFCIVDEAAIDEEGKSKTKFLYRENWSKIQ